MNGEAQGRIEPRAYRMVRYLEQELNPEKLGPRVMNLPSLLQRNGLLQVAVFLEVKGRPEKKSDEPKPDEVLRQLLEATINESLGDSSKNGVELKPTYLAKCGLVQTLLLEELALEAAVWIKRLYEAKTASAEPLAPGDEAQ